MSKGLVGFGVGAISLAASIAAVVAVSDGEEWNWIVPLAWVLLVVGTVASVVGGLLVLIERTPPKAVAQSQSTTFKGNFPGLTVTNIDSSADNVIDGSADNATFGVIKHNPKGGEV